MSTPEPPLRSVNDFDEGSGETSAVRQGPTAATGDGSSLFKPGMASKRARRVIGASTLPPNAFAPATDRLAAALPRTRARIWFLLGLGAALLGQLAGFYLLHQAATGGAFTGALLFTLCGLSGFIFPRFQRNSQEIWSGQVRSGPANRRLALDLTCLFAGILLGFFAVAAVLGAAYVQAFSGAESVVAERRSSLADLGVAEFAPILGHNLRVLLVALLTGVCFRYLGLLFVLIYNAALWGVVLASGLTRDHGQMSWWDDLVGTVVAVTPHLIAEGAGYVVAAMAGVFISRGAQRFRLGSRSLDRVSRAALRLVAAAALLIVVAAGFETYWSKAWANLWFDRVAVMP